MFEVPRVPRQYPQSERWCGVLITYCIYLFIYKKYPSTPIVNKNHSHREETPFFGEFDGGSPQVSFWSGVLGYFRQKPAQPLVLAVPPNIWGTCGYFWRLLGYTPT